MPEPLLPRIHAEIRARLRDAEPAVHEYERLETALAALDGVPGLPGDRAPAAPPLAPARARRRSTGRRAASGARAARGANREAVLRVLGDRPGVSVAELSTAAGVAKPVLYSLLKTLEQRGEVAKEPLPGGSIGYRLASPAAPEPTAASPEPSGDVAS